MRADACALPFTGARFGAVIAHEGLLQATRDRVRAALAEIDRVLRDEGLLVAALPSARADRRRDEAYHRCDEAEARALLAAFDVDSLALDEFLDDDGGLRSQWLAVASKRRP